MSVWCLMNYVPANLPASITFIIVHAQFLSIKLSGLTPRKQNTSPKVITINVYEGGVSARPKTIITPRCNSALFLTLSPTTATIYVTPSKFVLYRPFHLATSHNNLGQCLLGSPTNKMGSSAVLRGQKPLKSVNKSKYYLAKKQTLLTVTFFCLISCVNCDLVYKISDLNNNNQNNMDVDSPELVILILRNFKNNSEAISEYAATPSGDKCQKDVETVLRGHAESSLWATRSEWNNIVCFKY